MVVSYPLVNDRGDLTGAEVTLRFMDLHAIEHMNRWVRVPRTLEQAIAARGDDEDHYEIVPNCVTIYTQRTEFNIQADYADLKAKLIELNEWDEVE